MRAHGYIPGTLELALFPPLFVTSSFAMAEGSNQNGEITLSIDETK